MIPKGLRTWIEIDTKALLSNMRVFRRIIGPKVRLMAVAKSNAYGHSLIDFARFAAQNGADWIGVDSLVEAKTLRENSIKKPILVLGYTLPERYHDAQKYNASVTISSFETLEVAARRARKSKPLHIHIKVDTGMHRQGFFVSDIPRVIEIMKKYKTRLLWAGLYTHFAGAKNPAFLRDTDQQIALFKKAIEMVRNAGFKPIIHAAASSATLLFPKAHFDMVRVGIGLYGLWPSKEIKAALSTRIKLKLALSWKTIVGEIKDAPRGARVSYDFTETLQKESRIAVLPIGYWHGYPRALSSIGCALINGQRAKVLGRVCMDMIVVDVTHIKNIKVGDEAILLGTSGKETVSADDLAYLADTSNYEIVTRINPLIKRIYSR